MGSFFFVTPFTLSPLLSPSLPSALLHKNPIQLTTKRQQGYYGAATGKGRQAAKSELEKLDLASPTLSLSLQQAVHEAARIIYLAHEDSKDKEFELEMSWISGLDGPTRGRHVEVPRELREEAERKAKSALEPEDEEEGGEKDGVPEGGEEEGEGDGEQMEL